MLHSKVFACFLKAQHIVLDVDFLFCLIDLQKYANLLIKRHAVSGQFF